MRTIFFFFVLISISMVSADIISIGGTGGDEILFGYGNQIDLFFGGSDIIAPIISIISPANGYHIPDYVSGSVPVRVNFSVNETNIDSCWYKLTGSQTISNTTVPCLNGYNDFLITLSTPGSFSITVYLNDTSGNESSDSISMSMSEYTGAQTGGGSNYDPTDNDAEDINNSYDVQVLCTNIKSFLDSHENYTLQEKETLRNSLAIVFGFAISGELLDKYLEDMEKYCPDKVIDDTPPPAEKKLRDFSFILIIAIIVILILILIILYDHERLVLILNKIRRKEEEPDEGSY